MKKLLFLLMASFLVLAACGNEESKSEDKKETKTSDKENDKKKDDDKKENESNKKDKAEDKEKEEVATQDETTEQSQEQVNTQEQQPTQQPVQSQEQPSQQEPTLQEKADANAKVAKEHGYTGVPNGDAMSDVPVGQIELPPEELAKEEAKSEYQNTVEPEEESDWVKGQDEWMNASESEREEIRKADADKYGYEYDPSDYE